MQLVARNPQKIGGLNTVACQKTVQTLRLDIAMFTFIANQNAPAAPPQNQRRAESRGPTAHDDDVIHRILHSIDGGAR